MIGVSPVLPGRVVPRVVALGFADPAVAGFFVSGVPLDVDAWAPDPEAAVAGICRDALMLTRINVMMHRHAVVTFMTCLRFILNKEQFPSAGTVSRCTSIRPIDHRSTHYHATPL